MIEITWRIIPVDTPKIRKKCSRCGCRRGFICTGQFRMNAQQKNLDVWLIWQCEKCGCTWNMEVFSRFKAGNISRELYQGLMDNDIGMVYHYAYDAAILSKNKVDVSYDDIQYTVEGRAVTSDMLRSEPITLGILSEYDLRLRLDRLLAEQTGLPRSVLRKYLDNGAIISDTLGFRPDKAGICIKGDILIKSHPERM